MWYLQGITGGAHAVTLQEHKAALAAAAVAAKSYNLGVLTAYISTSKCVFVVAVGKSRRYWKQQLGSRTCCCSHPSSAYRQLLPISVLEHPVMVPCREEQEVLEAAARQEHKAALAAAATSAQHVDSFHQF